MKALLAFVLLSLPLGAREWTDSSGRQVNGTLVGFSTHAVTIRISGGRELQVPRAKLSEKDQAHLAKCEAHKKTANRLRAQVIQALDGGALVSIYKSVSSYREEKRVKYAGGLNGPTYEYVKIPYEDWVMVESTAWVRGLDTVNDGDLLTVILWTDGYYSYETVGVGSKRVRAYRLDPPDQVESIEAGEFGT